MASLRSSSLWLWAVISWLFALCTMAYQQISTVIRLGDVAYYMHWPPLDLSTPFDVPEMHQYTAEPCTILDLDDSADPLVHILDTLKRGFEDVDDVWTIDFLHTVVIQVNNEAMMDDLRSKIQARVEDLKDVNAVHIILQESNKLPPGPYFINNGRVHHAYRLYPDTSGAFVVATVPDSSGSFRSLDASAYGEQFPSTLTVAVPSRLYFTKTQEKPYAGTRLAVKDIMDLKGLKTGASSLAYTALYPPRSSTAEAIERLIELGFVVVGKLKTTQFADSEWPTCDWVDYHGPFNPRGDGYLTTSGSSAGSASAIASYDWLDFTLGTDTLGSIRAPAAAQGIFGMRSSLGAASFKGIIPYSPKFDTVGGFARTAKEFKVLANALYGKPGLGSEKLTVKKPTRLLYPTEYWPSSDATTPNLFESFIQKLEKYMGVARTEFSLHEAWERHKPEEAIASSETLSEYCRDIFDWGANPDQWSGLFQDFLSDYINEFGKLPVLNPQIRFKVSYLPNVTSHQQAEATHRLKVYQKWFYSHVMPPAEEDGYSSTILLLPWTTGVPDYRDTYKDGPQQFTGTGFFFYNVGPYAEAPELIVPVGTTPYESKLTHQLEHLPAAIGLVASKGSDVWLAELVADLLEPGEQATTLVPPVGETSNEQKPLEVVVGDL